MTILGVGSFPYVLDTTKNIVQYIPVDTKSPVILSVVIVPEKGPYGSGDGIYYLFKKDDTLIVKANEKNQPWISHISSSIRTRELGFALKLLGQVGVTPYYSIIKTNPKLYSTSRKANLERRDKLIDSLSRPYIDDVQNICRTENIDPQVGLLYRNHFVGNMIHDKLLLGYRLDASHQRQINIFYKDSISKWFAEMNCEDCENVPFYNLALSGVYQARFMGLTELPYLDSVSRLSKGYAKSFLLSNYLTSRLETTASTTRLLNRYDSLCADTLYRRLVHNNYALHQNATKNETTELATLMKTDNSKSGFNQTIARLKGNIIYIDFWASWCKPCVEEIPSSHSLKEKLRGKNVRMIYISLDTDFDNWRKACERFKLEDKSSFVLINPEKNKLAQKIKLGPIPRYIVIDKSGKIVKLDASRPSDPETYEMLSNLDLNK